jgi:hypothetical protein
MGLDALVLGAVWSAGILDHDAHDRRSLVVHPLQGFGTVSGVLELSSTDCMEIKDSCGATWPSKVLKGKQGLSNDIHAGSTAIFSV